MRQGLARAAEAGRVARKERPLRPTTWRKVLNGVRSDALRLLPWIELTAVLAFSAPALCRLDRNQHPLSDLH